MSKKNKKQILGKIPSNPPKKKSSVDLVLQNNLSPPISSQPERAKNNKINQNKHSSAFSSNSVDFTS